MPLFVSMWLAGGGVAGSADRTAPIVSLVSPAEGPITSEDVLTLDVTDDSGGLSLVLLTVAFPYSEAPEVAFGGSAFTTPYLRASTQSAIANGYRFALIREGGWPASPTVSAYALDTSANEAA